MKKFVYLIQGESTLIKKFFILKNRPDIDVILLTYDQKVDGAVYLPNSTWGEGRNLLLEKALASPEIYDYYIFLDDDIRFHKGSYELFEQQLVKYAPAIAFPVFQPKTVDTVLGIGPSCLGKYFLPFSDYQICRLADAQFIAFHRHVIEDGLVIPLHTQFDEISWWCTSSTQQILIFNFYGNSTLQFNSIVVANDSHRAYPNQAFKAVQQAWLEKQFRQPVEDKRRTVTNLISFKIVLYLLKTTLTGSMGEILESWRGFYSILIETLTYTRKVDQHLSEQQVLDLLKADSELFAQYRNTTSS